MYGILYNKTLMNEKGWDVPTNFSQLEALCEEIKKEGMVGYYGVGYRIACRTEHRLALSEIFPYKLGYFSVLRIGTPRDRQSLLTKAPPV